MEIKYTIEILTKDIQDIEKLVGNLQNYKEGSAIELDLALSKLRNVYEILTMIRADRLEELFPKEKSPVRDHPEAAPPVAEAQPRVAPEPAPEAQPGEVPAPVAEVTPPAAVEPATEEPLPHEPQPAMEGHPQAGAAPPAGVTTEPSQGSRKEAEILAEKFSAQSSINENLAGKRAKNLDVRVTGKPIDNIPRNIGINDRFLIIRELFNGDAEQFTHLVNSLDTAGNYQNALNLLEAQFGASMEHDGVEILSGLVKRRYIQQ